MFGPHFSKNSDCKIKFNDGAGFLPALNFCRKRGEHRLRYYMLNKSRGTVSATSDPFFKTVMDCFPTDMSTGLYPVGRLDIDTEGLLVITDDGELTFRLTRPEFGFVKRYLFMAFGSLTSAGKEKIEMGGVLYGNGKTAKPARIEHLEHESVAACSKYIPAEKLEHCMKNPGGAVSVGIIAVTEGQRHEVKLLLKGAGCSVFYLKRLSVGEIHLDESLAPGEFREFTPEEKALAEEYRKIWIDL